jgi:hypothetical protein
MVFLKIIRYKINPNPKTALYNADEFATPKDS